MKICDCGRTFKEKSSGNGSLMCASCVTNRRRFSLKQKAVDYLGGKCIDCGYSKCIEALEFDHLDPSEKEFGISGKHSLKWETIKKELDKCQLRCANCHRERHAKEKNIPKNYIIESHIVTTNCKQCSKEFTHIKSDNRIYCSNICSGNSRNKISWPEIEDLTNLLKQYSFVYVANILGVSDNAIRKRLVKYGIDPKNI